MSDPSPVVRFCVVRALDERYDYFLCQTHHLQSVFFFLLQDEALAIRAAGLQILGGLTRLNPAPILPYIRQFLVNLIIEHKCGGDQGRVQEGATRLLIVYLSAEAFQRLVLPVFFASACRCVAAGGSCSALGISLAGSTRPTCPCIANCFETLGQADCASHFANVARPKQCK